MKIKRIFLIGSIALLFLSARQGKITVYDLKYVEEHMQYIPASSFNTGEPTRTVSVNSFYMCSYEMTNGMYCYYLHELQKEKVDTAVYNKALPDTLVWESKFAYNEPYVNYYLRHPAYADYPLVGVNYDQAMAFCQWLTISYNSWPERKYKNAKFDLPSKDQWICAARGGKTFAPFPWDGEQMTNKENKWMANFLTINQSNVYRDTINGQIIYRAVPVGDSPGIVGDLNDAADITVAVNSFFPNEFGLYNMAGNVEEMVREKGITKGGSWHDTGYYLQNEVEENYSNSTATSDERGFRIMMMVEK